MIIQPTSIAAQLWAGAVSGTTAAADTWRVGTLLTARILGQTDIGKLLLDIGGLTVEADAAGTSLPQQFQVRVLTQGTQPQLEVMPGKVDEQVAMQGLRERLPLQNGYAQLLGVLSALASRPEGLHRSVLRARTWRNDGVSGSSNPEMCFRRAEWIAWPNCCATSISPG